MKQQDMYKLLAFFLVFTMIFSIFAYIFINPRDDTRQQSEEQTRDYYDPEFWTFNQPFDSISDALNMTPVGAESARYIDLESMTLQMADWTKSANPLIAEVDSIYKSNTTRMFYSDIKYGNNRSFLLLSTMFPQKNDFEYIVYPYYYYHHPILIRQEQGLQGFYNVMGSPVILAPQQTVIDVLDITTNLNETATSYDRYKGLLSKVPDAPFQTVTSNVTFAKQFYMGIRGSNGTYERTTAYLDMNSSVMKKLDMLRNNGTQRGISQYNITRSGNYTTIQISSGDMAAVLMEDAY